MYQREKQIHMLLKEIRSTLETQTQIYTKEEEEVVFKKKYRDLYNPKLFIRI